MDIVGDNSLKNQSTTSSTTAGNDPKMMETTEKSPEMFCSLLEMMKMFSLDDIAQKLCLMSQIPMLCEEMRNYGYLPMLVRLLHQHSVDDHDLDAKELHKTNKTRRDLAQALSNIVTNTSKCEKEIKILKILEDLKAFTETLCMRTMAKDGSIKESSTNDNNQDDYYSVEHPCSILMDLCKMCNEPQSIELIELFGGVYVISEVIKFDYKCHPKSKNEDCFKIRLFALMIITHLTYNNPQVKSMLGAKRSFIQTLIDLLQETNKYNNNEDMMQTIANVIQNLSWDSNYLSMQTMRDCQCVTHLTKALLVAKRDSTIKCLLAALGNLTASSPPNKADFCKVDGGLKFLISILEMNRNINPTNNDGTSQPSNSDATAVPNTVAAATAATKMKPQPQSMAIVEAGGCILRNISSYLANEERYRKILRENKAIPLLLEHLESSSLNVVANACVILSNLSATIATNMIDEESSSSCASSLDQIEMIELNAVKKLANLKNSRHKIIKEGAMATYKHLVTSQAYMLYSSFNSEQEQNKLTTSMSFSSFPMRKFKALKDEISNLTDMGAMSASACASVRLNQPKSATTRQQQQQQQLSSAAGKSSQQMMNEKFSRFSRSTSDTFATYHFQNTNQNSLPMSESMMASIPGTSKGSSINSVHNCDNDVGGGGGVSSEYDIYSGDAKCQIINSGNNTNNGNKPIPSSSASSSSFLEEGEIDEDYTTDFSERYKEQNLDEFRIAPDTSSVRRSSLNKSNQNIHNNHDSNVNNSSSVKDCVGKNSNDKLMKNDCKTSVTGSVDDTGTNNNNQDDDNDNSQNNPTNTDNGGEDSVKIYQTEGTPLMFSLVSSLLDLSEIDLKCINEEDEGKQQQQQQPSPPSTNQGPQQSTQPHKTSIASQKDKKLTMSDSSKPILPPKPECSPKNLNKNNNTSDNHNGANNNERIQDELNQNSDIGCDATQSDRIGLNQNGNEDNGPKGLHNENQDDDDDDDNIGVGGDASADSALKFETENTPAIFSHATSLSSLTVDDEDDENPCDQINDTTSSNVVVAKTSTMVDIVGEQPDNVHPTTDPNNIGQPMKTNKMMMKTTSVSPMNKTIHNKQTPPPPPPRLEQRLDPIGSETNKSNRLQSSSSSSASSTTTTTIMAKLPFGKQIYKQNSAGAHRQQQQQQRNTGYHNTAGYIRESYKNNSNNRPEQSQPRSHVMVVGVCPKKLPLNESSDDDDDDEILQQCIECALPTNSLKRRSSHQQKSKQPRSGIVQKSSAAISHKTTSAPPPVTSAMQIVGQFSEHHSSLSSLSFDSDTGIGTSSGATITTASTAMVNPNNNNNNNNNTETIINSDIDDLDEVEDNQLLAAAINLGINCNITSPASTISKQSGGNGGGGGSRRRSQEGSKIVVDPVSDSSFKPKQQQQQRRNNSMVAMVTNQTENNSVVEEAVGVVVGGGNGNSKTSTKNPSPKSMMNEQQDSNKGDDDDDEKTYTICFQGSEYSRNESQQQPTNVVRSPRKPRRSAGSGGDATVTMTKATTTKVSSKSIPIPSARTTILNNSNNNNIKKQNSVDDISSQDDRTLLANRKDNNNKEDDDDHGHDQQQQQQQVMQSSFINLENTKPPSIMEHCHSLMSHSSQSSSIDSEISDIAFDQIPIRKLSSNNDLVVATAASNCAKEINTLIQAGDTSPSVKDSTTTTTSSSLSAEINMGLPPSGYNNNNNHHHHRTTTTRNNGGNNKRNYSRKNSQQDDRTFEIIPKGGSKNVQELNQQQHQQSTTETIALTAAATVEQLLHPNQWSINEQQTQILSRKNTTNGSATDTRTYNKNDYECKRNNNSTGNNSGGGGGGLGNIPIGYNYYESDQSDTDISEILPLDDIDDVDDDGPPANNTVIATAAAAAVASAIKPTDNTNTTTTTIATVTARKPPISQNQFMYNKPNIEALNRDGGVNQYLGAAAAASSSLSSSPKMHNVQTRQNNVKTTIESGGANHGSGKKIYPAHQKKHNNSNRKDSLHYSCGHQLDRLEDLELETRYYRPSSQNSRPIPQPRSSSSSTRHYYPQQQQQSQPQQLQHGLSFNPFGSSSTTTNTGGGGGFDSKLNFNQISRSLTRGHKFMNSQADFEDKDLLFTSQHRDKVAANHVLYFQNKSNQQKINNSNTNNNCKATTKYFDRLASPMLVAKSGRNSNADALIDDFDITDDDGDDDDDDDDDEDGDDLMQELMDPSLNNKKQQRNNEQGSVARIALPTNGKNNSQATKKEATTKRKEKSLLSKLTAPFTSSSSSLSSNQPSASVQALANQQPAKDSIKSKVKKSESKSRFGLPWRRSKSTHDDLRLAESVSPSSNTLIQQTSINIDHEHPNVMQKSSPSSSSSPPPPPQQQNQRNVPQSPSLINRLIPARRSLANHEMMTNLSRNLTRSATFDTFANDNKKPQTIQTAAKEQSTTKQSTNDGNFRFTTFVRSSPANDNNNNATNITNMANLDQTDPESKPKQQQQQQHRSSLTKLSRKTGQKKTTTTTGLVDGNGNKNSTDNVANRKTCLVTTV